MKEDNVSMPFLEHLEELRWRLVRCAIAILLVSAVIWFYQEWIIDTLFLSMKDPSFITYRLFCQYFKICI